MTERDSIGGGPPRTTLDDYVHDWWRDLGPEGQALAELLEQEELGRILRHRRKIAALRGAGHTWHHIARLLDEGEGRVRFAWRRERRRRRRQR